MVRKASIIFWYILWVRSDSRPLIWSSLHRQQLRPEADWCECGWRGDGEIGAAGPAVSHHRSHQRRDCLVFHQRETDLRHTARSDCYEIIPAIPVQCKVCYVVIPSCDPCTVYSLICGYSYDPCTVYSLLYCYSCDSCATMLIVNVADQVDSRSLFISRCDGSPGLHVFPCQRHLHPGAWCSLYNILLAPRHHPPLRGLTEGAVDCGEGRPVELRAHHNLFMRW